MTSSKDLQNEKAERELHKNTQKVLAALKENPLGLSGNQLTTICRLSIKTVRNIIATRKDITEDLGVYSLNTNTALNDELIDQENTEDKAQESTDNTSYLKRDLQSELLEILKAKKDAVSGEELTLTLQITSKQLSQALWLLRKKYNIVRTGDTGNSSYQLKESSDSDKPATQTITAPSLLVVKEPVVELKEPASQTITAPSLFVVKEPVAEKLTHVMGIEISPAPTGENEPNSILDGYKSQIKTVVTRKSKLKLEASQVSELLSDIFGLSQVDWFIEGGNLVGVLMSDEKEMVA